MPMQMSFTQNVINCPGADQIVAEKQQKKRQIMTFERRKYDFLKGLWILSFQNVPSFFDFPQQISSYGRLKFWTISTEN